MDTFSILMVCTGNICRSALAEQLLRSQLRNHLGAVADFVHVSSAGTHGLVGHPMDPDAAEALDQLGEPARVHRGRLLEAPLVAKADLVLTATQEHRAAAVRLHPRATRHTFTLREFARLATAVDVTQLATAGKPADRLRASVVAAAALRGCLPPDPGGNDIEDPYRRSTEVHNRVAAAIARALEAPVALFTAVASAHTNTCAQPIALR